MNNKKITALFVCICMLFTMFGTLSVNAEVSPVTSKLETFDNFTNDTNITGDGYKLEVRNANNWGGNDIMAYTAVDGAFGKDDPAVRIHAKNGTPSAGNTAEKTAGLYFRETSDVITVSGGEYYEVSYDMALDGTLNAFREIRVNQSDIFPTQCSYLMQIDNYSKVTFPFLGITDSLFTMKDNHWYSFRIVIKSNNSDPSVTQETAHNYWLYINGILAKEGSFVNSDRNGEQAQYFKGFSQMIFYNMLYSSNNQFSAKDTPALYMDNIGIAKYVSMPEATFTKKIGFDGIEIAEAEAPQFVQYAGGQVEYREGGYLFQETQNGVWSFEQNVNGNSGYSILADYTATGAGQRMGAVLYINSNPMLQSTDQYYTIQFDAQLEGDGNFWVCGNANGGGDLTLINMTNNTTGKKAYSPAVANNASTELLCEVQNNAWNNYQMVFKSSDISGDGDSDVVSDAHEVWIYVNGDEVYHDTTELKKRNGGAVNWLQNFTTLTFISESTSASNNKMRLDNLGTYVSNTFPDTASGALLGGDADNSVDIANELKANSGYFDYSKTTAECISGIEFAGGVFDKDGSDISAKLFMKDDTDDIQRIVLVESGNPDIQPGEWYMVEANMAKSGTQSSMGIYPFYTGFSGDGMSDTGLVEIAPDGNVYVLGNETGTNVYDDEWHKYTVAIRAGDMSADDEQDKNFVKLYLDGDEVYQSEFVASSSGTEQNFEGIHSIWLYNCKSGEYDADEAAISAAYFDDITVSFCGSTGKFNAPVLNNEGPEITVSGIVDGGEYDGNSLPEVIAVATDKQGIQNFECYVDGELYLASQDDVISISLNGISGGDHKLTFVARDAYGMQTQITYSISLVVNKTYISFSSDFENGIDNRFVRVTNNHGYANSLTVDSQHGNAMAVGVNENVDETNEKSEWYETWGNAAYMGIPIDGASPSEIEFDFYVSAKPAKYSEDTGWQTTWDDYYRINIRDDGDTNVFYVRPDYIELQNVDITVGSKRFEYDAGKWYRMVMSVNPADTTYTISFKDGDEVITSATGSYNGTIKYLRVWAPYHGLSAGYFAIDNIVVTSRYGFPQITPVEEQEVKAGSTSFTLNVSEKLKPEDVTKDTLELTNEIGKVAVESVMLEGNTLTINTTTPLYGSMEYTVTLPGTTRYEQGEEISLPVEGKFTTSASQLDIVNGVMSNYALSFDAINTTGAPVKATIVFRSFDNDGKSVAATAVEQTIAVGNTSYSVSHGISKGDGYITAYILDGLNKPKALSPVVYIIK